MIALRPTTAEDLDEVLRLERHPDNVPFIGQWSREEHLAAIAREDREHWIITREGSPSGVGYLITYDLRAAGHGVYVKRIVVADKSRGVGRTALGSFCQHAFDDLDASHVWLTVYPENERGQRSYRALGFVERVVTAAQRADLVSVVPFSDTSLVYVLMRGK